MVTASFPATTPEPVVFDRTTRDRRHLWYRLEVVQQPERARACGAGPKSSADRRPVDPPPVVELRIFEGATFELSKDITFTYNANFFLFATLEQARVIAHGRVQTPSAAMPPVLTGMPVSGMAYLDRPQEAGYFLFPDLSVRHEGRYRLTFNLYEQTKETGDLDAPTAAANWTNAEMPESFDWRMEVKSNDFTVYSAKKFPGLTESTALSRTVAEQGCRVRIRRDVRMRRREGKSAAVAAAAAAAAAAAKAGPSVRPEDEYPDARRHRTATPEVISEYRARSMSTESVNRAPYGGPADGQRRPSMTDYHHPAPSPQAGPSLPPSFASGSAPATNSRLYFGREHSSYPPVSSVPPSPTSYTSPPHSAYPQPPPSPLQQPERPASRQQQHRQHQPPQPPQAPHPSHQHPQHAQHHSASSFSAPSPSMQASQPSPSPYYQDRPPSQHYMSAQTPVSMTSASPVSAHPSSRRNSMSNPPPIDYPRRMSASYTSAPPPPPMPMEAVVSGSSNDYRTELMQPRSMSESNNRTTLPPLSEMIASFGNKDHDDLRRPPPPQRQHQPHYSSEPPQRHNSMSGLPGSHPAGGSMSSVSSDRVPSLSQILLPNPVLPTPPPLSDSSSLAPGKKRSFGQYTNLDPLAEAHHLGTSMKNHARQPEGTPVGPRSFDELCWKRADGTVWSVRGEMNQSLV